MDFQDFSARFKEQLNIRYESHAAKWDRDDKYDEYLRGRMDEIDSIERIFDKLIKEYES